MKNKLSELGLTEEQIKAIIKEQEAQLKEYVKKEDYEEVKKQTLELNKQIKERDLQLEIIKKNSGDNDDLKNQIAELQKSNTETENKFQNELKEFKINSAIENISLQNGVKSTKALKALLNFDGITVSESGVLGLEEQINKLKESDSFLFEKETIINPIITSKKTATKETSDPFDKFLEQKKKEQESLKGLDELKVIN